MAPLDSNPDDHAICSAMELTDASRLAKTEDARNSQAAPALVLSDLHHHTFLVTRLWKNRQRAFARRKPCARTFAPSIFPSTRFQVQLTVRAFNVLYPWDGCSSYLSVSRLCPRSLPLRCLRCTGNGKWDRALTLLTTAAAIANTFAQGCNSPRVWSSQMITVRLACGRGQKTPQGGRRKLRPGLTNHVACQTGGFDLL